MYAVDQHKTQARAQVLHADAENYWVSAHGRLHRLQATFKAAGPGLLARWPQPPLLGAPAHGIEPSLVPGVLYVTTQLPEAPTCLVSAVDAEEGRLLWQRQLGCLPQRQPLAVGPHILLRDANGLFRFDAEHAPAAHGHFQPAGELLLREPLADDQLALLARGKDVLELSWPSHSAGGCKLRLRQLAGDTDTKITTRSCEVRAAPHGTAALGAGCVILPLANGVATRLNLGDATTADGPTWRGAGADETQPGHAVTLTETDFLLTDGNCAVKRIHWPTAEQAQLRGQFELPHRIIGPPAVLAGPDPRVVVADASGTVTLLDARLQPLRRWSLAGTVTTGPFVRDGRIGCVVGRNRLVWLDPQHDGVLWEYTLGAEVVGEPPLVDGMLIVADVLGKLLALDPATGAPRGTGYTLRANVAPAAAPLPFGPGRLFVPLTDGTILLLPIKTLTATAS
jgi:hypothetical protein